MRFSLLAALFIAFTSVAADAQFVSDRDRREAIEHYRAGQELMSAEQFEKAADTFQRAIEKDPLLTLAHYGLGQANMALRRYASAIRAFTGCRDAFRTLHSLQERNRRDVERRRDDELHELRETLRRMRQMSGMTLKAAEIERRIDELDRQRSSLTGAFQVPAAVSLSLGSAYFRFGRLDEAEREYRAALAADPGMGEAHNNLAVVLFLTDRLAEAGREIERAKDDGFSVNPLFERDLKVAEVREASSRR